MRKISKLLMLSIFVLSIIILVSCRANVYTINFELNGGTPLIESVEVRVGEKVAQPEAPSKEGHSFAGWFIDSNFIQEYNFDTKVNNDYTLYAKWNVNKYSIFFNSTGGTSVDTLTFDYDSELKAPTSPSKAGYQFDAWYIDEECTTKFDWASTMPAQNLTLYAGWEANKYKVIYISLGVEIPELEQTVPYNSITTKPTDPVREGYTFKGWMLNGNPFDFNTLITKSITLAASWEINKYTLSYNTNGGSAIESVEYDYNENLVKPANPTREGYTFAGWKLDDAVFDFVGDKMPAENIELQAVWTANDYIISYNKNNVAATGSVANTHATYDEKITISTDSYALVGYTFVGWNTKADGTGTTYQAGDEVKNLVSSGIYELFAIWTPNTYTVKFDANSGNGEMADQSFTYNKSATLTTNTFTKVGYTFVGWTTQQDGLAVYTDAANYTTPANNVTLYAVWKANTYNIVFDANSGTGEMNDLSATYDVEIKLSNNSFEKVGYAFTGWNTKADGTGTKYTAAQAVKNLSTGSDVTLYATWEAIEYTLTINIQNTKTEIKLHYNDSIPTQNNPVVEGFEFDGWVTIIDGKEVEFSFENAKMPSSNLTVIAKFKGQVNITFISEGVTYDTIIGFVGNDLTETVIDPVKVGYTFEGWYLDNNTFENEHTLPSTFPAEGYSVYAKWSINKYTVTFDPNNGDEAVDVELEFNSILPTQSEIELEGYTFKGWYTDKECTLEIKNVPASSIVIYAKWEAHKYTVSYDGNSGTGTTLSQETTYDTKINLQNNNFSKLGYIFDSWNTKADGKGTKYAAAQEVLNLTNEANGQILLYAIWTPIKYTIVFDANGGAGDMDDLEMTYDQSEKLTKNSFGRIGYTFLGWSDNASSETAKFEDEEMVKNFASTNGAEFTLYAIWADNYYDVKFIVDGEAKSTVNVKHGTSYHSITTPDAEKVGRTLTWKIDGKEIESEKAILSYTEVVASYTNNPYTVSFVVNNKEVYTVTGEYGTEISFNDYIKILENDVTLLQELEDLAAQFMGAYMSGQDYMAVAGQIGAFYAQNKTNIDKCAPNSATTIANQDFGNLFSIVNSEKTAALGLLNSYSSNNGNPSLDGFVFKNWVLGEGTKYENKVTGDVFDGFIPASDVLTERAYIVASFAGINPIDDIETDSADKNKITWTPVDINSLGFNDDIYNITVKYELYNKINSNEYVWIASTENQSFYKFLTDTTYSVPGEYHFYIIAIVTITNKSTGNVEMVLTSDYADNAYDYLLSMSQNNLTVDQSGDYYYRGEDETSNLTTFYFYTNMTYDFTTPNFVLTDENGNNKTYTEISIAKGATGNNSVIKTGETQTAFYFKTSADSDKVFYAKVLPLVSSFSFGKELTQFNSIKNGSSLFLNSSSAVYQIGAANPSYSTVNNTADYYNNGFEFKLDIRTSGGKKIDFKKMSDFLVYKFYKFDETENKYIEVSNENNEFGTYISATNVWEFVPTSGKYKVEISIKEIYVAPILLNTVITPLTFEFELNDRVNVFSHEVLRNVYNNTSVDFRKGLNIHSNITPVITNIQKYTEEAANAGNPLMLEYNPTLRDGSTVNAGVPDLIWRDPEIVKKFSGNVYSRVSSTDLFENYIISGNLFSIEGQKLPYSSIESCGNLSGVSGYKIANQQNAIFLYAVTNYNNQTGSQSTSRLNLNDINITGNTTVPALNSSSESELESSIDLMNRNSGGYLGVFVFGGSHMTSNNTIINNTTIAIKLINDASDIRLNYFYSQSNWQNAIFSQTTGNVYINNSVLKNSGGAAIHMEDYASVAGNPINSTVYIDQNTIIDNYVSGEEGYFKAYSLEFAVMQMKSSMNSGVEDGTKEAYTMLKTVTDPVTGLPTSKVNFIFLSIPRKDSTNSNAGGTQTGNVGINVYDVQIPNYATHNYNDVKNNNPETYSQIVFNKIDANYIPVEGMLMSCNNIPGMGNAFIVAGVYKAQ